MTPDLAMVYMFASNFAPSGYAMCNGQILSISSNTALFSLVGTTYGGNGQSTFGLPDLRGRVAIHEGQGPGTSPYGLGQMGGAETITLSTSQLPAHSHVLNINNSAATATGGSTTYLAAGPTTGSGPNASVLKLYTANAANTILNQGTIGATGSNQPVSVIQPYLTLTFVIALQGVFPSRN